MHTLLALVAREAALLLILLLLGSGPAALLAPRFDGGSRIALAPALGFCVGTCVTTTILQFAPTDDTYWILLPLCALSLAVAAFRVTRSSSRPRLGLVGTDLIAMLIIIVAVVGPTTYVLTERHTVGPGIYTYTDGDNYVATQDAARTVSLHDARQHWLDYSRTSRRFANLTQFTWSFFADFGSNLDATPLDSNVNALLNLGATDTFAPFLVVLLLAGALGAFAAVRYFSQSRTWTATLAGCLFGGPMFLELWFDSYQAAIVALGLLIPFVMLAHSAITTPRRLDLLLLALVVGAMLTVYPLYIPVMAIVVGAMLLYEAVRRKRSSQPLRLAWRPVALSALAVIGLSIVFDLVGFTRDVRYYKLVVEGKIPYPRVGYHLPLSVLPGWIAQTREFWDMPPLGTAGFKQLVLGGLVPLIFAGIALIGLNRYRSAITLVVAAVLFAVVAEYAYASQQACTYCAERDLLPLTPIAAVLIGLGLCALTALPARWASVAAIGAAALIVAAVAQRTRIELIRFANASYFMDSADRTLLARVPRGSAAILEEGFGASLYAQAEQPLVYHLINERAPGRVSIVLGSDVGNAIQYLDFGNVLRPGPEFNPAYRYVLTRLGTVATDRRVIARSGGIALEERVRPLDVTPYAGLALPLERVDGASLPWVQTESPLQMYVTGNDRGRRAWARLTFWAARPPLVPRQAGVTSRFVGHTLTVCVPARGREPIRSATVRLTAPLYPGTPPKELFPPAMPLEGLGLTSMQAVTSCAA